MTCMRGIPHVGKFLSFSRFAVIVSCHSFLLLWKLSLLKGWRLNFSLSVLDHQCIYGRDDQGLLVTELCIGGFSVLMQDSEIIT